MASLPDVWWALSLICSSHASDSRWMKFFGAFFPRYDHHLSFFTLQIKTPELICSHLLVTTFSNVLFLLPLYAFWNSLSLWCLKLSPVPRQAFHAPISCLILPSSIWSYYHGQSSPLKCCSNQVDLLSKLGWLGANSYDSPLTFPSELINYAHVWSTLLGHCLLCGRLVLFSPAFSPPRHHFPQIYSCNHISVCHRVR